jgi:hypothetical protein
MSGDRLTKLLDYKTLRLLMGIIALVLPLTVSLASSTRLYSVSGAYYTEARYILLVMLFLVGLLLFAYSGHSARESMWSKVAAVSSFQRTARIAARRFPDKFISSRGRSCF